MFDIHSVVNIFSGIDTRILHIIHLLHPCTVNTNLRGKKISPGIACLYL